MTKRRRGGPIASTLGAVVALAFLAAGCSQSPSSSSSANTTTTRAVPATTTTTGPAGTWSKAIKVGPNANLSVVSCPAPLSCLMGSTTGQTYRLFLEKVSALDAPVPSPSPQGDAYLSCAVGGSGFCAAAPNLNQVAFLSGSSWQMPATIPAAQGITAIDCTGPTFCITIDGEGNSFAYDGRGWSGNIGAWGAANGISCVSPSFCIAAEGGPSVFDGHTWTQPGDIDSQGQLNSVSCATTTFCVIVDSNGAVLTWNGATFSAPTPIATEPPLTGTNASGLTSVSCPATTFCRAVDSLGRVFAWNGTTWSAGTLIDNGHALTSISCPTVSYCVTVDRSGNAFVSAST
ncbi:MAG TPA: hypothetical protein VHX67_03565 [Acidimicrobiales bacterium]|nr:hypothetical protein [Acidimicrobiales bacterium]